MAVSSRFHAHLYYHPHRTLLTARALDAVLMAEVAHHFYPKLVELHNYPKAESVAKKKINWTTLNSTYNFGYPRFP